MEQLEIALPEILAEVREVQDIGPYLSRIVCAPDWPGQVLEMLEASRNEAPGCSGLQSADWVSLYQVPYPAVLAAGGSCGRQGCYCDNFIASMKTVLPVSGWRVDDLVDSHVLNRSGLHLG